MRARPIGKLTRAFADQGLGQFFWKASNAFSRGLRVRFSQPCQGSCSRFNRRQTSGYAATPDTVPARCIIDVTDPQLL